MNIQKYSDFKLVTEEESLWDTIKYGFSKLGRYKAGGSIFGKGETDKKAAEEMGEIMGDASNALIKATYNEVKRVAPEFPNDRRRITFLRGVILYGQLYDSIEAATKKDPSEQGYLDPTVANKLIENLQKVVKKALDVDLAAVYSVMDSKDNIDIEAEDQLFEDVFSTDYDSVNEFFKGLDGEMVNEEFLGKLRQWKDAAMDKLFGKEDEDSEARKAGSRQSAKLQGAGDDQTVDSERMKTLDSNKLPLILLGVGGALGALSWMAQTDWFKDLITQKVYHPAKYGEKEFTTVIKDHFKADPKGWSYTLQNNGFMDATGKSLNFNQPAGNLHDAFKFYGGGDEQKGMEIMSKFLGHDKAGSVADLSKQFADPSNKTVGDIFNKLEGTWGNEALMNQNGGASSVIATQVYKTVKKVLLRKAFTTTTTSVIGGKLVALAPILGAAGIALVGAGLVVKLLREKGKRQSRAKTLNDLLQSLKPVPVNQKQEKEAQKGESEKESQKEKELQKEKEVATSKSIYPIMIKNLKALQSMIITYRGASLEGQGGSEEEKDQTRISKDKRKDKELQVGKIYLYTNKKGVTKKVKLISLTHDTSIGGDKKWLTKDDVKVGELAPNAASVIYPDKEGNYSNKSPEIAVAVDRLKTVKEGISIERFEDMIIEKTFSKGPRNMMVGGEDSHATQALKNVRRSIKSFLEDKMKVDKDSTIVDILADKMDSDTKDGVKELYSNIYEYLFGKYSKTLGDVGVLYKESLVTDKSKNLIFAEKMARLHKRTQQFEGENLYAPLGEFGEDLKTYNETMKEIMDYYKSNENITIKKFGDYFKS